MKQTHQDKEKGFTLIELLVVISIIALLSTIVLSSLGDARAKSRNAKRVSVVKQYMNALELYRSTNGFYPSGASKKCLGLNDASTCIKLVGYAGSTSLSAVLSPYISGTPPLTEPVTYAGFDMSGLTYMCATYSGFQCVSYELYWIGEGTNPFCGGGYTAETLYGGNATCRIVF